MIEPGDIDTRPPHPEESLYGFIADVTAANDLVRVALIAGAADRMYGHRPQLSTAGREELMPVAELLEVDVAELLHRTFPIVEGDPTRRTFFGTTIARQDVRMRVRYFSPAALAKEPYHRAIWQLRIPFDVDTGEILVSTCPQCRRVQRWRHSAGIAFCDACGDSLNQDPGRIDAGLIPDVAMAVGLTHPNPDRRAVSLAHLPEEIASLGAATAYELLLRIVPVVDKDCRWAAGDRLWSNDPHHVAKGMASAWRTLTAWPSAFREVIGRDLATSVTRHSDGNRGETLRFLRLRHRRHLPKEMRDVITRLHASIDLSGPDGVYLRSSTMTCKEVAKLLGDGTVPIVVHRRNRIFRTIGLANGDRMAPVFDRAEIHDVARDYRRRRHPGQAQSQLGLPGYAVDQLFTLGRLAVLTHPYFAARFSVPQLTTETLEELIDGLASQASPDVTSGVPLIEAMKMVGGRLKPWGAIIEAMLSGSLRFLLDHRDGSVFPRVRVVREELAMHVAATIVPGDVGTNTPGHIERTQLIRTMLSKTDAAEVLNLSIPQSSTLLARFPTSSMPSVPVVEVVALARTFVTNAEIAARLGCTTQTVVKVARNLDVQHHHHAGYDRKHEAEIVRAVARTMGDIASHELVSRA